MKKRNITVFADHGDHGNFLTMALNVLVGDTTMPQSMPIFDFWTKEYKKFSFIQAYKMSYSIRYHPMIWIERNDPMLWAYNICTRAILSKRKDLSSFAKGITIHEFENDPWKWGSGSDITRSSIRRIKKNPDGSVNRDSLKKWYKKLLLSKIWFENVTPPHAITIGLKDFYNFDSFLQSIMEIERQLEMKFAMYYVEHLYTLLQGTMQYDIDSVYTTPCVLLDTYDTEGIS